MAAEVEGDAGVARAIEAAQRVFNDPRTPPGYEPRGVAEVDAAVATLAERFRAGGGTLNEIIENARAAAEVLSDDPFQALSEIIQNADDAGATRVRVVLIDDELIIAHDGRRLTLRDAHALAAPWLTTKRDDAIAVGRFGIGLMTVNALADSFEMHSGDYHVQFGAPTLNMVAARTAPDDIADIGDTILYVRLRDPDQASDRLLAWASRWDDAALLFLRSVRAVQFSAEDETRSLGLSWKPVSEEQQEIADVTVIVRRRDASSTDGRVWAVHGAEFPTPRDVKRAHKATKATTPIAVALGLSGQVEGMVYAGLPIASIDFPLRANAQFDPIASRQGVAPNAWNRALVPLVAELWCHAVVSMFRENASSAWVAVPLGGDEPKSSQVMAALHESLLTIARTSVADLAEIEVDDSFHWIGDLAHEVPELEGLLKGEEVARLADMNVALPEHARDASGRWRSVLDDWRQAGNDIVAPVTILDALRLLEEEDLAADRALALSAIALDHGLEQQLALSKCVIRPDGMRSAPPRSQSLDFLVAARSGLAVELGLGTPLHECHLAHSPDAQAVLAWLDRRGSILPANDRAVLTRLAEAGKSGSQLSGRLDDTNLVSLRDALEGMGQAEWAGLAPAIGRAIRIEGVRYDDRGRRVTVDAPPPASYIGRTIDKEPDSFAVAAERTPGLVWVAPRYANVLRSSLGRQGLGALKFLRLLGAETSPRVAEHPGLEKTYTSSPRRGLPAWHTGAPQERGRAITALGGGYTLEDSHSPDLDRVLQHLAADRKPTRRRARAAALIATLGRAWSSLGDHAEVTVASAYHGWNRKGATRAWWLWKAATTAWLDDDSAKPRRPIDLRLRTPATLALHGTDPTGYLHRSFRDARVDVLEALGVVGEPSTAELCERLVDLRDDPGCTVDAEAAVLYRAIADHLGSSSHTRGDLTPSQLRKVFDDGPGLVHTNVGWRKPSETFTGKPIFGDRAPFAPAITGADRLWRTLNVRAPGTQDCISVLATIGKEGAAPDPATQTVLLETQRELVRLIEQTRPSDSQARRLARLPLWTTAGWTDKRPVYAVQDPVLAAGLADTVPVWQPGGEVAQFAGLFKPLRLIEVAASAGEVIDAAADIDEDLTQLLRATVKSLHDDLVRNDPGTASALRIAWPAFEQFQVAVSPELTVRVPEVDLPTGPAAVAVNAKAAVAQKCIYVTDGALLGRLDGGGRAIAGLFDTDHRRVAQAWLAALELAVADQNAEGLRLAGELAAEEQLRNDELIEQQTRALQQQVKARRQSNKKWRPAQEPPPESTRSGAPAGNTTPPRNLVDPSSLRVVNPEGDIVGDRTPSPPEKSDKTPPLREHTPGKPGPQQRSSRRAYTDIEKETIGLRLALQVLDSDDKAMADLRAQRGVGADAMDELRQFYELKVYAGAEPDEIRLTDSEVRRAIASAHFFLVVVSGVEEGSAEHKVRVIAQPLQQLHKLDHRDMRLGGVRKARSLIYQLSRDGD